MEQNVPITSSDGNVTATPSSAGPSFTPPIPVQSSDINCIDKTLQAVFESESQDKEHDESEQMYLSGSSGSEEKTSEKTAGSSNVDPTQATLDVNYARGVMAGVAAMKPQFKAEFIERHSGDGYDKKMADRMITFCEEQTAKRNDGHANLKELMISSLMSELLLKVRKDLQTPDNTVKNLLPVSGALHDRLPHSSTGSLPIPGEQNTQIDADLLANLVSETLTFEDLSNLYKQ